MSVAELAGAEVAQPEVAVAEWAADELGAAEFAGAEVASVSLLTSGPGGSTTTVTRSAPLLMYLNKYLIEPVWLHHSTLM